MKSILILPSRFQPFHNDHLKTLRIALNKTSGQIFLGIVVNTIQSEKTINDFEIEARKHNSPERNPFTPVERITMIRDCLQEEFVNDFFRIIPILLPRPEANWTLIKNMFNYTRIWVVPDAGEEFDNMKANFFESMGDRVLRIKMNSEVDGYSIRSSIKSDTDSWRDSVPNTIRNHVDEILKVRTL